MKARGFPLGVPLKTIRPSRFAAAPLRVFPLLATLGLTCAIAFVPAAPVAHAQALPTTVGLFDESKIADGYKELQTAMSVVEKRGQDLEAKIPAREYLNETEGKAFDSVVVLTALSPAQQTQIDGLVKTGTDRKAEYIGLIGKANRTPTEETRLKELQALVAGNRPNLNRISQTLLESLRKQQDDVVKKYLDKVDSVISQVATDRKLVAVLRKEAVVWSADNIDITDDVLKRLNQK